MPRSTAARSLSRSSAVASGFDPATQVSISMLGALEAWPISTAFTAPASSGRSAVAHNLSSPSVADSPMRSIRRCAACSMRDMSEVSCRPRSVPMKACNSSMMMPSRAPNSRTASLPRRIRVASSDSGVISKIPSQSRRARVFADCETSPCHLWSDIWASAQRLSRRRCWSFMRALSGLM